MCEIFNDLYMAMHGGEVKGKAPTLWEKRERERERDTENEKEREKERENGKDGKC